MSQEAVISEFQKSSDLDSNYSTESAAVTHPDQGTEKIISIKGKEEVTIKIDGRWYYKYYLCACGCGRSISIKKWHKNTGIQKYIGKHYSFKKETTYKLTENMKKNKMKFQEQKEILKDYSLLHDTLCACGCGNFIPIGIYHRYKMPKCIPGHTAKETREKMKISHIGMMAGEKNPNFNNWSSKKIYPRSWCKLLKYEIAERDNFICQYCGKHIHPYEKRSGCPHHIDYNKRNCSKNNLIWVCVGCNAKFNVRGKKSKFKNFFKDIMDKKCQTTN